MKVTAVYFSPTRGSAKYVIEIAKAIAGEYEEIDITCPENRTKKYSFGSDNLVVFGAPVYGGKLPLLDQPLFHNILGDNTPAIFTVTYGNREFDDALLEMQEFCEGKGFRGIAAAALLAEHTYSRKLAGGRPDMDDLQQVREFAVKVSDKLNSDCNHSKLHVPGNKPYRQSRHMPMLTTTTKKCIQCGTCSRICPAKAIGKEDFANVDERKCIGCLACLKGCPENARKVAGPDLDIVRNKLEPSLADIHKENRFFL